MKKLGQLQKISKMPKKNMGSQRTKEPMQFMKKTK
jgi:hypothetical protein